MFNPYEKLQTRRLVALLAVLPVAAILVYAGYFFYLAKGSLVGATAEQRAFLRLGDVLVIEAGPAGRKYPVVNYSLKAPDTCSFWKFEAIRTHCRGVGIVFMNYSNSDRDELTRIANHVAKGLAKPCSRLHLLPIAEQPIASGALGCGSRNFSFMLRVQAISSKFTDNKAGGGTYVNELIHMVKLPGSI